MNTVKNIKKPENPTQSTFLVGNYFFKTYVEPRSLKGKFLSYYLHKLLKDPQLEHKLRLLKPMKWKKHYQDEGQDLQALYFYPDEADWARLSIISNGTGFSRCYIFVYLMLLDLGVLKYIIDGTQVKNSQNFEIPKILSRVLMDKNIQLLTRTMQT
jgi:hypothetical protein